MMERKVTSEISGEFVLMLILCNALSDQKLKTVKLYHQVIDDMFLPCSTICFFFFFE